MRRADLLVEVEWVCTAARRWRIWAGRGAGGWGVVGEWKLEE